MISNNFTILNMDFLCKVCDRSILENKTEYKEYLSTFRKKNDNSLDKKYTINNFNPNDIDARLND